MKLKIPRNHRLYALQGSQIFTLAKSTVLASAGTRVGPYVQTQLIPHEHGNGAGGWVGEVVHWKMPPDQVRMSCVLLDNSPIWALIFPICKMEVMNYKLQLDVYKLFL